MGIDTAAEARKAALIKQEENKIRDAISSLENYKASIQKSWNATEVAYVVKGVDLTIADLKKALNEVGRLSQLIVSSAQAVKKEEEAKAEAARALQRKKAEARAQEKIRAAQAELDKARLARDEAREAYEEAARKAASANFLARPILQTAADALRQSLDEAEKKVALCEQALATAGR